MNQPRLLALSVLRYKNLSGIRLPWSDGIALFGANGSGKTNLLECMTLVLGSEETVRLALPRLIIPDADSLNVDIECPPEQLPWGPDVVVQLDLAHQLEERGLEAFPALARANKERKYWLAAGVSEGGDFSDGISRCGISERVSSYVRELSASPQIRYELSEVRLPSSDPDQELWRRFTCTLLAVDVPAWLKAESDGLPDLFAPFRSALAATGSSDNIEPVPLLALPGVIELPAVVQWLPRGRAGGEARSELVAAFREATGPVGMLTEELANLPVTEAPLDPDAHWWLHKVGERAAREELRLTLPYVDIRSTGDADAYWDLIDTRGDGVTLGRTRDDAVLEQFSAGERRWVDEALATMTRELTRFGARASWQAALLDRVDADVLLERLLDLMPEITKLLGQDEFWDPEALEAILVALDQPLAAAARDFIAENAEPLQQEFIRSSMPGIAALDPRVVVRIFDEPEAHLHPSAQRALAAAIDDLRLRGSNVVIASHSPHFLGLADWSLIHVERLPGGTTVTQLAGDELSASSAFSAALGLHRGELLTTVGYVLLVEGEQDRLVLEALFGADLRSAGVAMLRIHGTDNLLATAEMDFVERYLDVPLGVLTDYTRTDRVQKGRPETDEERRLVELRRACRRRGRRFDTFGLRRPDVVAYLSETAIRNLFGPFPGWTQVLQAFTSRRTRPPFKPWVAERYDIDFTKFETLTAVLAAMKEDDLLPEAELMQVVNTILARSVSVSLPNDA